MKAIKTYLSKIDAIIDGKKNKAVKKPSLLVPLQKEDKATNKDLMLIANIVQGIREAREEFLNGRK
jgi:hypothetical protein